MSLETFPNSHEQQVIDIHTDRVLCADNELGFYHFVKLAWHTVEPNQFIDNWHIRYLCYRLQKVVQRVAALEKKDGDLIINVPPRSSKSSICTVFLNAWCWTRYPHIKFITASYSATLSETHTRKTKDVILSDWYLERWGDVFQMSQQKNTNSNYENTKLGSRLATSVGGTLTGMGAMVIICDDLINPSQSRSTAERETAIHFFRNTLSNRLDNSEIGVIILIQQRTHSEDIVGSELKQNDALYKKIIIPAEDTAPIYPAELQRFYKDGLFEPVRFSRTALEVLKSRMTDYAAQYLQKPVKVGGDILKWEWFFEFQLNDLYRYAQLKNINLAWHFALDGAYTKNKQNDPSVCLAFCIFDGKMYIRNIFRAWCSFTELLAEIPSFLKQNGYSTNSHFWIEPKANGLDLIDALRSIGVNAMKSFNPTQDKIQMVYSITPALLAQRVGILAGALWVKDFKAEIEEFPKGSHDDQIDTLVIAVIKELTFDTGILASN
jgi:predicted phage terminase large subunit-like protein